LYLLCLDQAHNTHPPFSAPLERELIPQQAGEAKLQSAMPSGLVSGNDVFQILLSN
jgi:hypothetical protein